MGDNGLGRENAMSDDVKNQLHELAGSHGSTVALPCARALERIEALEARLSTAVKALTFVANMLDEETYLHNGSVERRAGARARATLAILKGDTNE